MQFLSLSGLPNATIPVENVYGDLVNDQSNPGGEAQLDVEYIMVGSCGSVWYIYLIPLFIYLLLLYIFIYVILILYIYIYVIIIYI